MKVARFFETLTPVFEHRAEVRSVATSLWGSADCDDARRLGIHVRDCQRSRQIALDGVFQHVRQVVIRDGGAAAWDRLSLSYFEAHPPRHFEPNANGAAFPAFVQRPEWLAELADLEWWDWRTFVAPDTREPGQHEPRRLADTLELRAYRWDLLGWMADGCKQAEPASRQCVLAFWRDRQLDAQCREVDAVELAVLRAVRDRAVITPDRAAIERTLREEGLGRP
jgi:hypothetical protein